MSYSKLITNNNQTITVLGQLNKVYGQSVGVRQETIMAKIGTLPSVSYDNTYKDAHISLTQTMNESDREEPMKEEVSNKTGEHTEAQDKVTYLLLSRGQDFAGKTISR